MLMSRYRIPAVALVAFVTFAFAGLVLLALRTQVPIVRASAVVDNAADLRLAHGAAITAAAPAAAAPAVAADTGPKPPGRIIIRSIGVNAPVVVVGLDTSGAMGVPSRSYETAWYKFGPSPGDAGDAVIDGHLDWYDTSRAVFYNLRSLKTGDDIEVQRLDGVTHHFRVSRVQSVSYNATVPGLFVTGGPPRLSLITCGGTWDTRLGQYLQRVIVDSTFVS